MKTLTSDGNPPGLPRSPLELAGAAQATGEPWQSGHLCHEGLLDCTRCPRLVTFRTTPHAVRGRSALATATYWAAPVPAFGDPEATVLILGLAPGFHGAHRTGVPFCGDVSGRLLYGALHSLGRATHADPEVGGNTLRLHGIAITNSVKCVPPDNAPTPDERRACNDWLRRDLRALDKLRWIVAFGAIAHNALLDHAAASHKLRRLDFPFAHGSRFALPGLGPSVIDCFHPSPLNSNRGLISATSLAELLGPLWDA